MTASAPPRVVLEEGDSGRRWEVDAGLPADFDPRSVLPATSSGGVIAWVPDPRVGGQALVLAETNGWRWTSAYLGPVPSSVRLYLASPPGQRGGVLVSFGLTTPFTASIGVIHPVHRLARFRPPSLRARYPLPPPLPEPPRLLTDEHGAPLFEVDPVRCRGCLLVSERENLHSDAFLLFADAGGRARGWTVVDPLRPLDEVLTFADRHTDGIFTPWLGWEKPSATAFLPGEGGEIDQCHPLSGPWTPAAMALERTIACLVPRLVSERMRAL